MSGDNSWKTAKAIDFEFVFTYFFWKIKLNCMSGFFCIANLLDVGKKNISFLSFMDCYSL